MLWEVEICLVDLKRQTQRAKVQVQPKTVAEIAKLQKTALQSQILAKLQKTVNRFDFIPKFGF